jgi:hypothetical protein
MQASTQPIADTVLFLNPTIIESQWPHQQPGEKLAARSYQMLCQPGMYVLSQHIQNVPCVAWHNRYERSVHRPNTLFLHKMASSQVGSGNINDSFRRCTA